MTKHLLVLSIGPVQDFIAAARRTRDLWFGSFLLSEISKAAARAVKEAHGQLIFPAPENPAALNEASELNVANVILAELPESLKPEVIRQVAYDAAQKCWKGHAEAAGTAAKNLVKETIWADQVDDVIEFYAAWTPLSPSYKEARERVMHLLAGRKACRNFVPAKGRAGIPKSSLDGARETILIRSENQEKTRTLRQVIFQQNRELAQRLRLLAGEELDIIGLTKRAATKETFPSIVRVAADPWIRGIQKRKDASNLLEQVTDKCRGTRLATGTGNYYQEIFPYDGAVLYPSRLASMLHPPRSTGQDMGDFDDLLSESDRKTLTEIKSLVEKLQKRPPKGLGYGEPEPYLAILVADGDRMGKTISEIMSADEHRKFSSQLAQFAGAAREIVKSHHGCLVYSGGDDVLAFVPVDQCFSCARELHEQFGRLTKQWKDKDDVSPTLSVGIAIGHCMDPLEDLLAYGRAAERAAKEEEPKRKGLAVHLHPRSGAPICLRAQWTEDDDALDKQLIEWAKLHTKNLIPDKAAYDLRELLRDYAAWPQVTPEQRTALTSALRGDALQMLKRKRGRQGDVGLDKLESLLSRINSLDEAHRVTQEVLVARRIADAQRQAEGKPVEGEERGSA